MRCLLAPIPLLVVLALGCSPEPEHEDRIATSSEGRRTTREVAAVDPEPEIAPVGEPDPEPITIAGKLVNDSGSPIALRRFVSVGRDRDQRVGRTGPGGEIAIEGVVPPYDLLVEGRGDHGPLVLLGLTRADPTVELRERDGVTHVAPPRPIRLAVLAPPCGEERCLVEVATASPSGDGSASVLSEPNGDGDAIALVDLDHVWRTIRAREGERIELHVLVHDSANTKFAYARRELEPDGPADIGVVRASAVSTMSTFTPTAVTEGSANETSWSTVLALDVGAATFQLRSAHAASLATALPILDGASWRFAVSAATLGHVRMAWSGRRDLRAAAATPPLTLPAAVADVAVADGRLRWQAAGSALARIDVVDLARASFRYRIVTSMTDFPLAKLEYLGLRGMEKGPHELVLDVAPGASLDEATDPDPSARGWHRDPRRPGQAAYARVAFEVTP